MNSVLKVLFIHFLNPSPSICLFVFMLFVVSATSGIAQELRNEKGLNINETLSRYSSTN